MLNFTLATKVLAIAIITTAFACSKKDINEPQPPTEKGDFKVQINNTVTKATTTDPGSEAEKEITNLYLFLYDNADGDDAACVLMHEFSTQELVATGGPAAVFSLPESEDLTETYKIYAVANMATVLTGTWTDESSTWPSKSVLLDLTVDDLTEYNKANYSEAHTLNVSTVKPNDLGFLMSGTAADATPSPDADTPTIVDVTLERAACKFIVKASITQKFIDTYQAPFKSTIKVVSVTMEKLYSKSHVISKGTDLGTHVSANVITQNVGEHSPLTAVDQTVPIALMYSFENGVVSSTDKTKKPTITINVMYDFDGPGDEPAIPLTYDEIVIVGDLKLNVPGDEGKLSRNSIYTINVQIGGLSKREIVATITVDPWSLAGDQDVVFGD